MGSTPIVRSLIYIGTAGWNIPREANELFPSVGSHLERYAARLNAVEINSSFYRPHRISTYQRWAATVPADFRFSVKVPKLITHTQRLVDVSGVLLEFLSQATSLGEKLGPLLVQLPPSFVYDETVARNFFDLLRVNYRGSVVFEPRHATWFGADAEALLLEYKVARVRADPAPVPGAERPGGWPGIRYYRLHGWPRVYYSQYEPQFIDALAVDLAAETTEAWCVFDNTALGFAAGDALRLCDRLSTLP